MPGQGGADWLASVQGTPVFDAIHERGVMLFGTIPMPFNCRIEEFGARANLLALKPHIHLATYPADIDTLLGRYLCRAFSRSRGAGARGRSRSRQARTSSSGPIRRESRTRRAERWTRRRRSCRLLTCGTAWQRVADEPLQFLVRA